MNSFIWRGKEPSTKFGPKIYAPMYIANDGTSDFNERLSRYVLECEDIISKEELVSEVVKNNTDPYKYTQQWKQHNLIDDTVDRLDGNHLEKFKPNDVTKELFEKIRTNYLLFLSEQKIPRQKVWMHTWANVIRPGQNISTHNHNSNIDGYLACVYYPQTSPTALYLINPINNTDVMPIPTKENHIVFFPSWMPHGSDVLTGDDMRISIASDIVLEKTMEVNPFRPHILLDDPKTMKGL